jgi:GH15 family glucan-1,4-alpha-glucosidase
MTVLEAKDFYAERAARESAYMAMWSAYMESAELARVGGDLDTAAQYLRAAGACRCELAKMDVGRLNQHRGQ